LHLNKTNNLKIGFNIFIQTYSNCKINLIFNVDLSLLCPLSLLFDAYIISVNYLLYTVIFTRNLWQYDQFS